MEHKKQESPGKKAYVKPEITRVQLVAEEAVLSTCKQNNLLTKASCTTVICVSVPAS